MRKKLEGWVVYKMLGGKKVDGGNSVCAQAEWEEMERSSPGQNLLIREGIANEPEAERVAREAPGGTAARVVTRFKVRL